MDIFTIVLTRTTELARSALNEARQKHSLNSSKPVDVDVASCRLACGDHKRQITKR